MKLDAYFRRIRYSGGLTPDLTTLNGLMGAHIRAVPFENLDVHAGRPVRFSVEAAFDQIVTRRQGGWCFEMNGLFGWVLSELGFEVTRLAGGVRRASLGDAALGNHLCLMVALDQDYLVDVGFGSTQLSAIPLLDALTSHSPIQMALAKADQGFWRLHEGGTGSKVSYDFAPEAGDEARLLVQHNDQITDPNSIFRKTLIAKIRRGDAHISLRGRMLETHLPGRKQARILNTPGELAGVLNDFFGLEEADLADLWPGICARHRQLFPHSERQSFS